MCPFAELDEITGIVGLRFTVKVKLTANCLNVYPATSEPENSSTPPYVLVVVHPL